MSFLDDAAASNLDFMDLLPYNYLDNAQIDPQILVQNDGATNEATFPFSITGVDLLSGINFDEEPGSSAANMSKDISDSVHSYWQTRTLEATEHPESMSSDLSNSANSPESQPGQTPSPSSSSADPAAAPGLRAVPSVSCGCLSSLYLALDSLTRLPADVLGAIRVARQATKVAHDVIRCPVCSDPLTDDPCKPPPIQCFQNLMCLAALVPSTCNAYAAILEMVDNEAAAAKREARGIWFSFKDIGGAWGVVGPNHYVDDCPKMAAFNNRNMAPDIWRTTMRAILRIDVYGIEPADDVAADGIRQRGLRDVVKLLEERSAKRHDQMDELFAAGKAPERPEYLLQQSYKPVPPEQRNCMIVLEAARIALDNLVIA